MTAKEIAEAFDGKSSWTEHLQKHYQYYRGGVANYVTYVRQCNMKKQALLKKKKEHTPLPTIAQSATVENDLPDKIQQYLKRNQKASIEQLSDAFDVSVSKVRDAIKLAKDNGSVISIDRDMVLFGEPEKRAPHKLDVKGMSVNTYRFGAIGDNHLCSKYERLDVLNALYDYFEQEGITTVYNTGNYIDGEARFNKHDIHTHGMFGQIDYFLKNYPQREGIKTYYIAGDDHEGWYTQREGVDIGSLTEMMARKQGREDLVYLGYMEQDVILPAKNKKGKTVIRVLHPGGGSSYAVSYTTQKIIESYQGGEKPDVLLIGHYHKAEYLFNRGVHSVQTGCTMDQSPFMRKKRLAAHLGGWIIEFSTDDNGAITRFKQEFIPFYDNNYYKQWQHKK